MTSTNVIPELKQIIGALLFAAREPLAIDVIRKVFKDAAKQFEGPVQDFGKVTDEDIVAAIGSLNEDLTRAAVGIHVGEVANGYRLQNDLNCGIWIRQMLEKGRNNRLSRPALETLAIIAYRQPCTRGEIEAVRGVAVDSIMKNLMEMQLVKAVGRSELPGRPWMFATTSKFLEYFGLKNVNDLPGVDELRRMEKAQAEAKRNEAIEQAPELPLDMNADGEQGKDVQVTTGGKNPDESDAVEEFDEFDDDADDSESDDDTDESEEEEYDDEDDDADEDDDDDEEDEEEYDDDDDDDDEDEDEGDDADEDDDDEDERS